MKYDKIFICDFVDLENSDLTREDLEIYVDCSSCNSETTHTKHTCVSTEYVDDENKYSREDIFYTIQCLGCKTISFCHIVEEDGNYIQTLYPSRIAGQKELDDSHLLPHGIYKIYRETHASINNSLYVLAGIGIRAIIEAICKDKNVPGNNLEVKISKMKELGFTTSSGETILHNLRFLGNKAANEIKAHNLTELRVALEVIDHLLLGVYILPIKTKVLGENT